MPAFLLCMHPIARDVALALFTVLVVLAVSAFLLRRRVSRALLAACLVLVVLSAWLGSYRVSPLGFSSGRIPLLSGFLLVRPERPQTWVAPMQVVTIGSGSTMGISPQLLPGRVACMWSSSNGGAFDDPASCDTDYSPRQGAAFDTLRVYVRSACGLPSIVSEIHISVLP